MRKKLWRMAASLTAVICLAAQVGCKAEEAVPTADELMEACVSAADTGYSASGSIEMSVSMRNPGTGETVSIPMNMEITMDVLHLFSHGKMTVSSDMGGQFDMEYYTVPEGDAVIQYFNQGAGWVRSEGGVVGLPDAGSLNLAAGTVIEKDGDSYKAYASLADFLSKETLMVMLGESTEPPEALMDAIKSTSAVCVFEAKTGQLSSVVLPEKFTYQAGGDEDAGMKIELGIHVDYERYGEITTEEVQVPDAVLSEADKTVAEEPQETAGSAVHNTPEGMPAITYGNQTFSLPFDYSILTSNGWKPESDSYFTFVCMLNEEYGTRMYAYNKDFSGDLAVLSANGVYGLQMDIDDLGNAPGLSLGGITWGNSKEEIITAFGDPAQHTEAENRELLIYNYTTPDGAGCQLTFTIEPEKGMTGFEYRIDTLSL